MVFSSVSPCYFLRSTIPSQPSNISCYPILPFKGFKLGKPYNILTASYILGYLWHKGGSFISTFIQKFNKRNKKRDHKDIGHAMHDHIWKLLSSNVSYSRFHSHIIIEIGASPFEMDYIRYRLFDLENKLLKWNSLIKILISLFSVKWRTRFSDPDHLLNRKRERFKVFEVEPRSNRGRTVMTS